VVGGGISIGGREGEGVLSRFTADEGVWEHATKWSHVVEIKKVPIFDQAPDSMRVSFGRGSRKLLFINDLTLKMLINFNLRDICSVCEAEM
jgi:hypothetical protein